MNFPWPGAIIVKKKTGLEPTDANKVVGHAEPTLYSDKSAEPTTLLGHSRDQADSPSKLDRIGVEPRLGVAKHTTSTRMPDRRQPWAVPRYQLVRLHVATETLKASCPS